MSPKIWDAFHPLSTGRGSSSRCPGCCAATLPGHRASIPPLKLSRRLLDHRHCSNIPTFRSEEHTSELQSLMRISYAVFCLKKKKTKHKYIISLLHKSE